MRQPNQPVLPGLIQLKWVNDDKLWRNATDPYLELEQYTGNKCIRITNPATGEIRIFEKAIDCAEEMDINPTTLNYRLRSKGQKVFSDGWTYAYYSDSFSTNINGPISLKGLIGILSN